MTIVAPPSFRRTASGGGTVVAAPIRSLTFGTLGRGACFLVTQILNLQGLSPSGGLGCRLAACAGLAPGVILFLGPLLAYMHTYGVPSMLPALYALL